MKPFMNAARSGDDIMENLGFATGTDEIFFAIAVILLLVLGIFRLDSLLFRSHHKTPRPAPLSRHRVHYVVEENSASADQHLARR